MASVHELAERDLLDALEGLELNLLERKTVLWLTQLDAVEPDDMHVLAGIIRKAKASG